MSRIRVVIVDDSTTVREHLAEVLRRDHSFEVVGEAGDGARAIELCMTLRPDVMTLDLAIPQINGLGVTEHVMAHAPTPIVIVSASMNRGEVHDTYSALAAGAVDVLDKARASEPDWEDRFVATVRMASRIKVITHLRGRLAGRGPAPREPTLPPAVGQASRRIELVALGASTGGPHALSEVLAAIPASFKTPILVVLHIDAAFATSFADWLTKTTGRTVACAIGGEHLDRMPGGILLAPPGMHLTVAGRRTRLLADPPRHHCKPSIDVLFDSMAREYRSGCAVALLTGMGRDGASGMLEIRRAGGHTIAQDEATSVVWGMPREAVMLNAAELVLPLASIGAAIARLGGEP
jgi:two-component system, chemotaxis family, protein-glutamate methylesterase/glutaminase